MSSRVAECLFVLGITLSITIFTSWYSIEHVASVVHTRVLDYWPVCVKRKSQVFVYDQSRLLLLTEHSCSVYELPQCSCTWSDYSSTMIDNSHYVSQQLLQAPCVCDGVKYTAPWASYKPHRVLLVSDSHGGFGTFRRLLHLAQAFGPYAAVVFGGDATQNKNIDDFQTRFFGPLSQHFASVPVAFCVGNHDLNGSQPALYVESPRHYAFNVGATRWVVLDSIHPRDRVQAAWLHSEMQSSAWRDALFRIVVMHIPPFVEYWDPTAWFERGEQYRVQAVREQLYQPLVKAKVDMVISGHSHMYARGQDANTTLLLVGGAGAALETTQVTDTNLFHTQVLRHHFVTMSFEEDTLFAIVVADDGEVIDEFSLTSIS